MPAPGHGGSQPYYIIVLVLQYCYIFLLVPFLFFLPELVAEILTMEMMYNN